uniref:Uncharacterized protein C16orf92 isoform 2 n=1 Tax=Heterocephalus glaber TaxID=10181 RepID=A0A0P6JW08_HETGA
MRLGPWLPMWVWLAALQAGGAGGKPTPEQREEGRRVLRPARTKALAPPVAPPRFVERPDFFDYPDSDQASLQAVAQFIGERPVQFVHSGSGPGLFHHILVGILVVAFFYLLFQFCIHELPARSLESGRGSWMRPGAQVAILSH